MCQNFHGFIVLLLIVYFSYGYVNCFILLIIFFVQLRKALTVVEITAGIAGIIEVRK